MNVLLTIALLRFTSFLGLAFLFKPNFALLRIQLHQTTRERRGRGDTRRRGRSALLCSKRGSEWAESGADVGQWTGSGQARVRAEGRVGSIQSGEREVEAGEWRHNKLATGQRSGQRAGRDLADGLRAGLGKAAEVSGRKFSGNPS
ncbi:unnamed protein product [Calypogeia fissa]